MYSKNQQNGSLSFLMLVMNISEKNVLQGTESKIFHCCGDYLANKNKEPSTNLANDKNIAERKSRRPTVIYANILECSIKVGLFH